MDKKQLMISFSEAAAYLMVCLLEGKPEKDIYEAIEKVYAVLCKIRKCLVRLV